MIRPQALRKGDSVYLLNISRKGEIQLDRVRNVFESWGLNVIVGYTVLSEGHCQFAAPAHERLKDLQHALDDKDIKAIFFCRGGYGAVQILDKIDFTSFVRSPKWIVGYSDITYLHAHIHTNFEIETVHGAMLSVFYDAPQEDFESIRRIIFGEADTIHFGNVENHRAANIDGELIGGNLSILHTIIGTPSDIDADGKILVIEDVFENLTSIERMLYALKRSGKLGGLKALLLGDFIIPIKDNEKSNSMIREFPTPDEATMEFAFRDMVLDFLKEYNYPVCFGLPIGHRQGRNIALNFGRKVSLEMTANTLDICYK